MDLSAPILAAFLILAQGDPGPPPADESSPAPQSSSGGATTSFLMVGVLFAVMYLLLVRPQHKKEAEERALLEKIKKNDHVVTRGGMYGIVVNVKDDEVVLKVDEQQNVKIRFQKSAIAAIVSGSQEKKDAEGSSPSSDSSKKS